MVVMSNEDVMMSAEWDEEEDDYGNVHSIHHQYHGITYLLSDHTTFFIKHKL